MERRSSTINKKIRRSCASSACFNNLIISSMYFPPFSSFFIIEQTFDLCILILAFFRYNLEIFSIVPFTLVLKKKKQRTFVLCFFIERFYFLCFLAASCGPLSGIVSPHLRWFLAFGRLSRIGRLRPAKRDCLAFGGSALKGSACAKTSHLLTTECAKRLPTAGAPSAEVLLRKAPAQRLPACSQ